MAELRGVSMLNTPFNIVQHRSTLEANQVCGIVRAVPGGCERCGSGNESGRANGVITDRGSGAVLLCCSCGRLMRVSGIWTYLITADSGEIKIGSAINLVARLALLQTGHPHDYEVTGLLFGGRSIERSLHRRFADYRLHGEWFYPASDLHDFIHHECIPVRIGLREFRQSLVCR